MVASKARKGPGGGCVRCVGCGLASRRQQARQGWGWGQRPHGEGMGRGPGLVAQQEMALRGSRTLLWCCEASVAPSVPLSCVCHPQGRFGGEEGGSFTMNTGFVEGGEYVHKCHIGRL